MNAVPLPWWTSRSTIATRSMPARLQHADGDGDVVERAEAFAVIRKRVMQAAADVDRRRRSRDRARVFDFESTGRRRSRRPRSCRRPSGGTPRPSPPTTAARAARAPRASARRRASSSRYSGVWTSASSSQRRRLGSTTSTAGSTPALEQAGAGPARTCGWETRAARYRCDTGLSRRSAERRRQRQGSSAAGRQAGGESTAVLDFARLLVLRFFLRRPHVGRHRLQRQRQHLVDRRDEVDGQLLAAAPASDPR